MNGKVEKTETGIREKAVEHLTGIEVVLKGKYIGDEYNAALAKEGAERILTRLESYGFKLVQSE